eukprot:6116703-Pyramimonas_sp.AAC.1
MGSLLSAGGACQQRLHGGPESSQRDVQVRSVPGSASGELPRAIRRLDATKCGGWLGRGNNAYGSTILAPSRGILLRVPERFPA